MILRIVYAVIVAVVVGLICILLGVILTALNVPPATVVGGFLTAYAWVIGIIAGLLYFISGRTGLTL